MLLYYYTSQNLIVIPLDFRVKIDLFVPMNSKFNVESKNQCFQKIFISVCAWRHHSDDVSWRHISTNIGMTFSLTEHFLLAYISRSNTTCESVKSFLIPEDRELGHISKHKVKWRHKNSIFWYLQHLYKFFLSGSILKHLIWRQVLKQNYNFYELSDKPKYHWKLTSFFIVEDIVLQTFCIFALFAHAHVSAWHILLFTAASICCTVFLAFAACELY